MINSVCLGSDRYGMQSSASESASSTTLIQPLTPPPVGHFQQTISHFENLHNHFLPLVEWQEINVFFYFSKNNAFSFSFGRTSRPSHLEGGVGHNLSKGMHNLNPSIPATQMKLVLSVILPNRAIHEDKANVAHLTVPSRPPENRMLRTGWMATLYTPLRCPW